MSSKEENEVDFTANNENQGFVYNNNNYQPSNNSGNVNGVPSLSPAETLSQLISSNDLDGVKAFLASMKEGNTNSADRLKRSPFVVEAIHNFDNKSKSGPSTEAAKKAKIILEQLVENQFSLTETYNTEKPLNAAASIENEASSEIALKFLILKARLPADGGKNERSPLFDALEKDHFQVADFLIRAGADVNKVVKGTPLLQAVLFELKNINAAEFLLSKGADINKQNLIEDTPLHTLLKAPGLSETYKSDVYSLLLKSPQLDPIIQDGLKRHPLLAAVHQGNIYGIQRLLDSPRQQFNSLVNKGPVDDLGRARWNGAYAQGDRTKTPILVAIKRSSLSPPEVGKNTAKEGLYNEILTELLSKGKLQKGDWNELFTTLMNEHIDFIEQILYQKQAKLLKVMKDNNVIDINGVFHGDNTFLTYVISLLDSGITDLETIQMILDAGANPNHPNKKGATPMLLAYQAGKKEVIELLLSRGGSKQGILIGACQMGLDDLVKQLLKEGLNPSETITINNKNFNAYDMSTSIKIRLMLAPYLEKDEPRFEGFKEEDFTKFETILRGDETIQLSMQENGICPICFAPGRKEEGCMYMREHNCKQIREAMRTAGSYIHIHEKLYDAYNENGLIKFCVICNRLTTDKTNGHRHYAPGNPVPVKSLLPRVLDIKGGGYYDATCYKNGGGDQVEKIYRYQELLNFMCFLNKKFIGKISQNMAYNIIKENFIACAMAYSDFFTSYQSQPRNDKEREVVKLKQDIQTNKKFFMPENCGPVTGEVGALKIKNKPNIPRPAQNAELFPKVLKQQAFDPATVEQAPVPPVEPPRPANNAGRAAYIQAFQAYQRDLVPPYRQAKRAYNARMDEIAKTCKYHRERHSDGRDLLQFSHRQSDGELYDHEDSLICKEGLVEYLNFLAGNPKAVTCFDDTMCDGYIHPLEIKDLMVTDDEKKIYEAYKKRFNNNPPAALGGQGGGARRRLREVRGGKRRTNKLRKTNKTHKAKHFGRTRKH